MSRLDIDMTEFKEFFGKMEQFAKGQFKEELIEYVDTIGFDFLRVCAGRNRAPQGYRHKIVTRQL